MIFNFLRPGLDPTSIIGTLTNAQLLQMWMEGKFAPDVGGFVWAQTAPDVVTYPDLATSVWGKLNGSGVRTGEFFWYDGANWQPWELEDGSLTGDAFADQSIGIEKLTPGAALQIPQVKPIAADGIQWVDPADIFGVNTIAVNKLAYAPDAGYVLWSSTGGVYTSALFSTLWANQFTALTSLPVSKLGDDLVNYAAGQVPTVTAPGNYFTPAYPDQLLRNGQVPTAKLQLGAATIGKTPVGNATGDDLDWISPITNSVALFNYGGPSGTAPQSVTTGGLRTVQWTGTSEQDPAGIVTLAANRFTFASTGLYLIEATVPVYPTTSGNSRGHLIWRNVTDATNLAYATFSAFRGDGWPYVSHLQYLLTVSDIAKVYELAIVVTDQACWLATDRVVSDTYPEVYQQIKFSKLS